MNHVHHVHLFASDIEKSLAFYQNAFGGKIILDEELAGARNVFMRVGTGRIHFYDQAPSFSGRGSIHHFGIQTDDIDGVVEKLKAMGVPFKKSVTDIGVWKYVMVPAPDNVLIELFQVNRDALPEAYRSYFD
ncbi:MAG: VOC family protein [Smithellaceae bacterium]|jgi:catechol 2,3-dioxygenase-like lactoylglutathione lyase family enzyme|nr:VOC family protein [Smithellaceae bacterium]MDD3259303.1 VOC family protein [Smithellaceae bacterium]MDD3847697.1 VOC family protein [Smithellaceae bacterium]HOG12386.1 VOC family protein [Smithellaceae bacterium]HOQ72104.1 VOC family protein [Smithellaceae bacterium]